jgi:multimeric flavodoxin WrbA
MKLLALMGSPREGGNTDMLIDEAIDAAQEAGAIVEKINLHEELAGEMCNGCLACTAARKCVVNPRTNAVLDKIRNTDALLLASPVWWLSVSSQVKALVDHFQVFLNDDFTSRIPGKKCAVMTVCGGKEEAIAQAPITLLSEIFTILGLDMVGTLAAPGFDRKGAVAADEETCNKARELARKLVAEAGASSKQ